MDSERDACLNCGTSLQGKFCSECGQKVIEPNERTVKHFIYQFLGSAFFLENNFFKNAWYLLTRPGRQAIDFIEGRRKRWMPPFSLLLLINLFYFWYSPLSDLNLKLKEQRFQVHHRGWVSALIDRKLTLEGIRFEEYEMRYNQKSTNYANSLIILHVPIFAAFLMLFFVRKRYYYVDHFIYAIYFLGFLLLVSLIQTGVIYVMEAFASMQNTGWALISIVYLLTILGYIGVSLRRTYAIGKVKAAFMVVPVFAAFLVTHMVYRTLLFLIIYSVA